MAPKQKTRITTHFLKQNIMFLVFFLVEGGGGPRNYITGTSCSF